MWYCALSKFSRKLSEVGRTTQYAKDMPIASSPIAAVTSLTTERSAWGEKAGARNAHACQRTTGSESASAVQKQMLNETMKGSDGLSVNGFIPCGSGTDSQSISLWRRPKKRMQNQIVSETRQMMIRVRSSVRCSTSDASSA